MSPMKLNPFEPPNTKADSQHEQVYLSRQADRSVKAISVKFICFTIALWISTVLSFQTACLGTHFNRQFNFIAFLLFPALLIGLGYRLALKRFRSKRVTPVTLLIGLIYVLIVYWLGWNISRMSFA